MKFIVTGATGHLGKKISRRWIENGHSIVVLSRDAARTRASLPFSADVFEWKADSDQPPVEAFRDVDGIIHLAGESLAGGRWTAKKKEKILKSRQVGSRLLMAGALLAKKKGVAPNLKVIVSSSAVGFYGDRGDEVLDEESGRGGGFLSEVCKTWEAETIHSPSAQELRSLGVHVCAIRIGVVLSHEGGALAELLPLFNKGLGGHAGSGKQWMSWIHVKDLISVFEFVALKNPSFDGAINATAPNPVTNAKFAHALGRAVKMPAVLPAPAFALKLFLGEMSAVILEGQKVLPKRLEAAGFSFQFEKVESALADLMVRKGQ